MRLGGAARYKQITFAWVVRELVSSVQRPLSGFLLIGASLIAIINLTYAVGRTMTSEEMLCNPVLRDCPDSVSVKEVM